MLLLYISGGDIKSGDKRQDNDSNNMVTNMKILQVINFNAWFGESHVLKDINLELEENSITGIIGPSGSGKTTIMRCLNRLNDSNSTYKYDGKIIFDGEDIYETKMPVHHLRQQIGMIFQVPCVFPKSIYGNMIFGLKNLKLMKKSEFPGAVEKALKAAHLFDEVKDRLHEDAKTLSVGQQQRLCIARALTVNPRVIMMDEPTSALDPKSTTAIEKLILELKDKVTLIVVTHNIEQAKRIADHVVFICDGRVVEQGEKNEFFTNPKKEETKEYIKWTRCECE